RRRVGSESALNTEFILLSLANYKILSIPFLFGPSRLPAAAGLGLLVVFIASPFLPPIATMPSRSWMMQTVAEATRVYGFGGFTDVLTIRFGELPGVRSTFSFFRERSL